MYLAPFPSPVELKSSVGLQLVSSYDPDVQLPVGSLQSVSSQSPVFRLQHHVVGCLFPSAAGHAARPLASSSDPLLLGLLNPLLHFFSIFQQFNNGHRPEILVQLSGSHDILCSGLWISSSFVSFAITAAGKTTS